MMGRWPALIVTGTILALAWLLGGTGSGGVAAAPPARSPGLVISEVYAPRGSAPEWQWFELHNMRTDASYPLDGLILGTSSVSVTLQTTMTLGPNLPGPPGVASYRLVAFNANGVRAHFGALVAPTTPILEVPTLGGLNPEADALLLYTRDGMLIDQVNWGTPQPGWPNYNAAMWNPGLAVLEESAPPRSWGRTMPGGIGDRDTDTGATGDWSIHQSLSLGRRVGPPPQNRSPFLGTMTDWIGVISGFLLWAVFILIGVIAYRFERLRETRTYWQLLLLAPSGILFYTIIVAIGFAQLPPVLTDDQKWLSFPILAASAVACLLAVAIFQNVARGLLEGD
jgi:hypothetical protein